MKKLIMLSVVFATLAILGFNVHADEKIPRFSAAIDKSVYEVGEYVKINIEYDAAGNGGGLGAFIASVDYDSQFAEYVKTTSSNESYVRSYDTGGLTKTVFTSKSSDVTGVLYTCYYKILKRCDVSSFSVSVTGIVDYDGNELISDYKTELNVEMNPEQSSEALLFELFPSYGCINETFDSAVFTYTMDVPYEVRELTFEAEISDGASYKVNKKNLGSGGSTTEFVVTVTSEDKKTKNIYSVFVKRSKYSSESAGEGILPEIISLSPSAGSLNENFSPALKNYTMDVPYSVSRLDFSVSVNPGDSYRINRKNLGSGGSITKFVITVISKDGKYKNEYTVSVKRGEYVRGGSSSGDNSALPKALSIVPSSGSLNEDFSPEINSYTMNVPYTIDKLDFKVDLTSGASYKVNRKNLGAGGSTVEFKIVVTAADGKTKNTYVVAVTRGEYIKGAAAGASSKSGSDADGSTDVTENLADGKNYVVEKYVNDSSLVVKNDSFGVFMLGAVAACVCMLVGALCYWLLFVFKADNKGKDKVHDKAESPPDNN